MVRGPLTNVESIQDFQDETDRTRLLMTLVHLRTSRGITQADVAQRMGIEQRTVIAYEQGFQEGREYSIGTIQRYARAIGVELRMWIQPKEPELVEPPASETEGSGGEVT